MTDYNVVPALEAMQILIGYRSDIISFQNGRDPIPGKYNVFFQGICLVCEFDMRFVKIPSGEITNKPYLEKVGRLRRKVIP